MIQKFRLYKAFTGMAVLIAKNLMIWIMTLTPLLKLKDLWKKVQETGPLGQLSRPQNMSLDMRS